MVASITHKFSSPITDAGNPNEVGPNEWNDTHAITGEALTKTDDTNVTLTLDAAAPTAVLSATNITVGWTGTLAANRLNSNVVQAVTNDTNITGSISAQNFTLGWAGTLAPARLNSNVVQGITNDTNITGSIATQNLTLGWTGRLAASRLLTGTSGYALMGNGVSDPSYQGFLQSGTSAVTRTWLTKAQEVVSLADFGAVGDGTTDDTAAIQAAINSLPTLGGRIIGTPNAVYAISSTINIGNGSVLGVSSKYGINLIGYGGGSTDAEFGPKGAACTLKWTGAAGATMVVVNGPIRGTRIDGWAFNCNSLANTGLKVIHSLNGEFKNLVCFGNKAEAFIDTAISNPASVAVGAQHNVWDVIDATQPGLGGSGMTIGDSTNGSAPHLDVAQSRYSNMVLYGDGTNAASWALKLQFTDNINFFNCNLGANGGTSSKYLYILPPTGNAAMPGEISFYHCSMGAPTVDASWTGQPFGIGFFPYPQGDGETIPVGNSVGQLYGFTTRGELFGGFGGIGGITNVASAATTVICAAANATPIQNYVFITGTTGISFFDSNGQIGIEKTLLFQGIVTLTHSASLILPNSQDITTAAGDVLKFIYQGSGVWRCTGGILASGQPFISPDITHGGTGQSSYTLGDTLYASATNTLSKLAGNTTTTKKFLQQTGTGAVSAAPSWGALVTADIPTGTSGAVIPLLNGINTHSGVTTFSNTTDATSSTAGAVMLSGGLAVAKSLKVGTSIDLGNGWSIGWGGGSDFVVGNATTHNVGITTNGASRLNVDNNGIVTLLSNQVATSSTTGTLVVTGGIGASGAIWAGTYVATTPTTVAGLPAATAGLIGARAFVTDDLATVAFNTIATGGGTNKVPVWCDGTNWRIG